jgi:hypothetical protein
MFRALPSTRTTTLEADLRGFVAVEVWQDVLL